MTVQGLESDPPLPSWSPQALSEPSSRRSLASVSDGPASRPWQADPRAFSEAVSGLRHQLPLVWPQLLLLAGGHLLRSLASPGSQVPVPGFVLSLGALSATGLDPQPLLAFGTSSGESS